MIGDSHAHHLAYGLNKLLNKPFLLIGHAGTPPVKHLICLRHEKPNGEDLAMEMALNIVSNNENIKTVILSSRWSLFTYFHDVPYEWRKYQNIKDRLIVFEKLFDETIESLLERGKKVIVLLDVPQNPINPNDCVQTRPFFNKTSNCKFPVKHHLDIDGKTNSIIRAVVKKYPSVTVYDPSKSLCWNGYCMTSNNSQVYYHDRSHLTEIGSTLIVRDFLRNVRF